MSLGGPRQRQLHATTIRRRPTYTSGDDRRPPAPLHNASTGLNSDDLKKPLEEEECNRPIDFGQRDWSFWLALVFVVAPVYLITPASWAYTLYTVRRLWLSNNDGYRPLSSTLQIWEWALFAYCIFESAFSIYYQSLARYARKYKSRVPQRDMHELQLIFTRVLQTGLAPNLAPGAHPRPQSPAEPLVTLNYNDPRASDYRNHFRLWFRGAPWRDITRESMRQWLSWSVFDKPLSTLDKLQRILIEEATIIIEKRAGAKLNEDPAEGKDHIEPLGLTWDPVNVWSRPGIIYVVGELLNRSCKWFLEWKYGMIEREYEGIGYLIRDPAPNQIPTQAPIVLMHGLGFGLAQYAPSIILLMQTIPLDRPVLIPLQPSISQTILHPTHVIPLSRDQWVNGLRMLIEKLRWDEDGVTMVSHSKGSLVHTWMLKSHPELIKRSCFVDPVCFCLWEGDLAWNFVYRRPINAIHLIMKYFAATEPGIALAVQRHFDWAANALWFEEIPRPRDPYYTSYFLGGKDAVIDANRVRRYLVNHGVSENLHWDPNGHHGQPVFEKKGLKALKEWILAPEPERPAPPSDSGIESSNSSSGWSESEDEVLNCIIPNRRRR